MRTEDVGFTLNLSECKDPTYHGNRCHGLKKYGVCEHGRFESEFHAKSPDHKKYIMHLKQFCHCRTVSAHYAKLKRIRGVLEELKERVAKSFGEVAFGVIDELSRVVSQAHDIMRRIKDQLMEESISLPDGAKEINVSDDTPSLRAACRWASSQGQKLANENQTPNIPTVVVSHIDLKEDIQIEADGRIEILGGGLTGEQFEEKMVEVIQSGVHWRIREDACGSPGNLRNLDKCDRRGLIQCKSLRITGHSNVILKNVTLIGNSDGCSPTLTVSGNSEVRLINCDVSGAGARNGVRVEGCASLTMESCRVHDSMCSGIVVDNTPGHCEITSCVVDNNGFRGAVIKGANVTPERCIWKNCTVTANEAGLALCCGGGARWEGSEAGLEGNHNGPVVLERGSSLRGFRGEEVAAARAQQDR